LNPTHVRNYTAGGTVTSRRLVKFDGSGDIVLAAAATDSIIGASADVDVADDGPCDVILGGVARVKAGGTITRGAQVTSDSAGKAVAANPDPTDTVRVAGIALESAVDGDEIDILLAPGSLSDADNS